MKKYSWLIARIKNYGIILYFVVAGSHSPQITGSFSRSGRIVAYQPQNGGIVLK
jgi:hypothetical protein